METLHVWSRKDAPGCIFSLFYMTELQKLGRGMKVNKRQTYNLNNNLKKKIETLLTTAETRSCFKFSPEKFFSYWYVNPVRSQISLVCWPQEALHGLFSL